MDGLHFEVRMTTLRGRAHIKIDPKGRISLPTQFRSALKRSPKLFITNNTFKGARFLDIYSSREWSVLENRVAQWPQLKAEVIDFQRYYLSSAEDINLDNQGRIQIPQHFRDYAGLTGDLVIVGMGTKLELWSAKTWNGLVGDIEKDFSRITQVLSEL